MKKMYRKEERGDKTRKDKKCEERDREVQRGGEMKRGKKRKIRIEMRWGERKRKGKKRKESWAKKKKDKKIFQKVK
jgi:hypothetical protein